MRIVKCPLCDWKLGVSRTGQRWNDQHHVAAHIQSHTILEFIQRIHVLQAERDQAQARAEEALILAGINSQTVKEQAEEIRYLRSISIRAEA